VTDLTQSVIVNNIASTAHAITCGVPQGSVLGPKQFIVYSEDVADIFVRHGLLHHQYADDMQAVGHGPVVSARNIAATLHDCITGVMYQWCSTKRLQLNAEKNRRIRSCSRASEHLKRKEHRIRRVSILGVWRETAGTLGPANSDQLLTSDV
jgi:hypothetical protein